MERQGQRKSVIAAALLAAGLLGWWWLRPEEPAAPVASVPAEAHAEARDEEPPTLFPRVPRLKPTGEPIPPLERLPPARTPVIEEVVLDKRSVCFNEDVQVTVKAHAGGLDDAFLRYRVAGEEGPVVSLRRLAMGGMPERGGYQVTVSGRDGTQVSVPLPELEVKDCRLPHEFELVHALEPGTDGVVRFTASPVGFNPNIDEVLAKGADPTPRFEPVRYVWTFGDGTTAETTEGTVTHDFSARPQGTRYSYFLVRCEAFDAEGRSLGASKSVELANPAFDEFVKKGAVRLLARQQPAQVEEEGHVTVPLRLWHSWATPVTVKSVKVRLHQGQDLLYSDEAHPPSTPAARDVFAASALGTSVIPAGGVVTQVRFDAEADQDVVAKEFRIEGETPEGWPVRGTVLVTRPDLDPLRRRMLVDADWRAMVLRARVHLKKTEVTEKEVMDLEGEGTYVDLPRAFQGTPPPGFSAPEPVAKVDTW
jgi:hypothetical protein